MSIPKSPGRITTTDAQIDAAMAHGRLDSFARIVDAQYDHGSDEVAIRFENGVRAAFPRGLLQGLSAASAAQLMALVIAGSGTGLYWPQLDVGYDVRGLMKGIFGTRRWMRGLTHPTAR